MAQLCALAFVALLPLSSAYTAPVPPAAASAASPSRLTRATPHIVPRCSPGRGRRRRLGCAAMELSEEEIDELVRQEVEAAFAGLDASLSSGDDEAAVAQIQTQGREIMSNVMSKLDDDGQLLSASLESRIEEVASEAGADLLSKYDESTVRLLNEMNVEREAIRTEVERLRSLNAEYNELKNSGPSFNRDKIVASISLIVGLAYLGSAINEVLKIVLNSGSGEALTAGLDGALALAGIGYFFVRRNGA